MKSNGIAARRIFVSFLVAAGMIGLLTMPSLAQRAEISSDRRTGNRVTISTENAFRYGRFLWVSPEADPPINYTFTVTTSPGAGWELATPTPPPSVGPLNFSDTRGLQHVVTVRFQTQQKRGDGAPEDTDELRARVFAIKFDYEFKREFDNPEVRNFIPANTALSNGKPLLKTELLVTTAPQVSNSQLMRIASTRNSNSNMVDTFNPTEPARNDEDNKFHSVLQTREKEPPLKVKMLGQQSAEHSMLPALYRSRFQCTIYYTTRESGYGPPGFDPTDRRSIEIAGHTYTFQRRFVDRVQIEGCGEITNPIDGFSFLQFEPGGGWYLAAQPVGATGRPLRPRQSCAVDRTYIKFGSDLQTADARIQSAFGSDTWIADDVGQAIQGGSHIDLYWGVDAPRSPQRTDLPAGTSYDTASDVPVILNAYP